MALDGSRMVHLLTWSKERKTCGYRYRKVGRFAGGKIQKFSDDLYFLRDIKARKPRGEYGEGALEALKERKKKMIALNGNFVFPCALVFQIILDCFIL